MRFLPTTPAEVAAIRPGPPDVLLVQGDAYIDHPSFGAAVVGRFLESLGLVVAMLAQPDWHSADAFAAFGKPRLFFGVTAGNLDSMLNARTAQKKNRSTDPYSPGGQLGLRPERASVIYAQRCREAFPGVPVILGGIEASLRRIAHYDYWSDTVRRSVLVDSKADLLIYGMGERALKAIVDRLKANPNDNLRGIRGTAWFARGNETPALVQNCPPDRLLPSYEQVRQDLRAFAQMTAVVETLPDDGAPLVQLHGDRALVIEPPSPPLADGHSDTDLCMDSVYSLPYAYAPHPSYREKIPAFETIKNSITLMRGCLGRCAFCAINVHAGRVIQSRSQENVLEEIDTLAAQPGFDGVLSDLGGPSANLYCMGCSRGNHCTKRSCLTPTICPNLKTDHTPLRNLLAKVRAHKAVRHAFVASGVRYDVAIRDPEYIYDLAKFHTGGQLSLAPEHASPSVLKTLGKPPIEVYEQFCEAFDKASKRAGKEQYTIPYFICAHPGCGLKEAIELALWLKKHHIRPRQVQEFIPTPMTRATAMYHTGLDPLTMNPVEVVRGLRERRYQKALALYWDPTHWPMAREALQKAGRQDLIGKGPNALVPPESYAEKSAQKTTASQKSVPQKSSLKSETSKASNSKSGTSFKTFSPKKRRP